MNLNKQLVTGGLALLTAFSAVAQDEPKKEKGNFMNSVSVGGAIGLSQLHGDIRQYSYAPVTSFNSELGLGGFIHASKQLNPAISLRGMLGFGSLNGTRRKSDEALWSYSDAGYTSMTLNVNFNLSKLFVTKPGSKYSYYISAGYGLISFRSAAYDLRSDNLLSQYGYVYNEANPNELGEKDSRTTESIIPVAFGITYKLNPNISLFGEIQGGLANSDKLDARIAGGSNDNTSLTSIGLTYSFAKADAVEEWEDPLEAVIEEVEDIKTKVDGLTKDSDGDGVTDLNDKEPNTPAGVSVDGAGRALDVDGDGVPDHQDEEISARGAKVDGSGRELDSDGDGVADSKDMEPNTEKGAMVNFQGVTITAKGGSNGGGVSTGLPAVYFNLNSATIDFKSYSAVAEVAKYLKANADVKLTVIGHTDASGSKSYNEKLGLRRAQSVIDHLSKVYGVDAGRLTASSKGKSEPLAKGKASNINRRVDFVITE